MDGFSRPELAGVVLSVGLLPTLVVGLLAGGISRRLLVGAGTGALVLACIGAYASWLAWTGRDEPDHGLVRAYGFVAERPFRSPGVDGVVRDWIGWDVVFTDATGVRHRVDAGSGDRPKVDAEGRGVVEHPIGAPERAQVVDPNLPFLRFAAMLVFTLVPLAMGLAMLALVRDRLHPEEDDPNRRIGPALMSALQGANVTLIGGVVLTMVGHHASGFAFIAGGALALGIAMRLAGRSLGMAMIPIVVGTGFGAFGLFLRFAG